MKPIIAAVFLLCVSEMGAPARAEPPDLGNLETNRTVDALIPRESPLMQAFLDRLMQAESGGRDDARNPRSTAVGPYQFIERTWLEVCRRHFAAETAGLTVPAILALRTNRAFARRAAEAFTVDNAAILARNGHASTPANLRLAFLLGASAAVRLLSADKESPVIGLFGVGVVQANPFMAGMTAADLAAWSARNLSAGGAPPAPAHPITHHAVATVVSTGLAEPSHSAPLSTPPPQPPRPKLAVKCNTQLASCQKWIVLAERRASKSLKVAAKRTLTR